MPIMYLDECMFTVRSYRDREYAAPKQTIEVGASEFAIAPIAFLGVICKDRGIYYYELIDRSVNS